MKVWITKYALTQGIIEKKARECGEGFDGMVKTEEKYPAYFHGEGKEWHRTKESAIKRAEEMRQKKIESLKKQIKKLEVMTFE